VKRSASVVLLGFVTLGLSACGQPAATNPGDMPPVDGPPADLTRRAGDDLADLAQPPDLPDLAAADLTDSAQPPDLLTDLATADLTDIARIVDLATADLTDIARPIDFAGTCRVDNDCSTPALPRCDTTRGVCVPCLATNDNCPAGQYCRTEQCVSGCKADSDCNADAGTALCNAQHQCVSCLVDGDCGTGTVCSAGHCVPGCSAVSTCPGSLTCCSMRCADLTSDPANCGGCGIACPAGATCCSGACADLATDPRHCGSCGAACSSPNAVSVGCAGGVCSCQCDPGWADCVPTPGNCCNTNTNSDVANCGGCGVVCSTNHVSASCAAGSCQSGACDPGWNDCNANKRLDGCESNPDTDPMNCGGCGTVCPASAPFCNFGVCKAMCVAPLFDCNHNPADGCEANINTDPKNCGGCGIVCSPNHVTPSCAAGVCNGTCDPGFMDCNGDLLSDGCEVNVVTDPNNCGACGVTCSGNHVTTRTCGPGANGPVCNGPCAAGFGDCNNNLLIDGCETNLNTNNNHCGSCGFVCPSGISCVNGACPCPAGLTLCQTTTGPTCVDINTATLDCGGCNMACSTNNITPLCAAGVCSGPCTGGFLDCNNNKLSDGCEIDPANDVLNCGGCRTACSMNNITAACVAGSCESGVCLSGFDDCNTNKRLDGCETNILTDPANCGGCGTKCVAANSAGACTGGVCVCACNPGFADCNLDHCTTDGCEVNLLTDNANCGTCGNACTVPSTSCRLGACVCPLGEALCGGSCISVTSDPVNCGGCGAICSNNHITNPTCGNGSCNGACDFGWGDCNANKLVDGCESDLTTDNSHCGVCGTACPVGSSCQAGLCTCLTFGQTLCGSACTDTQTDSNNCGGCNNVCPNGSPCVGGSCSCAIGHLVCGGLCVDPQTNVNDCGGCGNVCSMNNVLPSCAAGACQGMCFPGYGDCNHNLLLDGCESNLNTDNNNCGACGTVCGTGAVCVLGGCSCSGGTVLCGTNCVSTLTSVTNCGGCGRMCSTSHMLTLSCAAGACNGTCQSGFGDCNADKLTDGCEANFATDNANCGQCNNACPSGTTCQGGLCICANGLVSCGGGGNCVDLKTDPLNCGTCSHMCASGSVCQNGACGCPTGQTVCGLQCIDTTSSLGNCGACSAACSTNQMATFACTMSNCVGTCLAGYADCDNNLRLNGCETNLLSDNANCGACGNACAAGTNCVNGMCPCGGGNSVCGGLCVDTSTSLLHCGGCNMPCSSTNIVPKCQTGSCQFGTCSPGFGDCNNNMRTDGCEVDLNTDANHCGTCTNACPAGISCVNGSCACAAGQTACSGSCVNTLTDSNNCGLCGHVCTAGTVCSNGSCCTAGLTGCGLGCVNTSTDSNNCGTCGHACQPGNACQGGVCVCNLTVCSGACVNTSTDSANCGTCGHACPTMAACQGGACVCMTGLTLCGGACVNTTTDSANCGTCGTACPTNSTCQAGACVCTAGLTR
jgi:hypothetical protein